MRRDPPITYKPLPGPATKAIDGPPPGGNRCPRDEGAHHLRRLRSALSIVLLSSLGLGWTLTEATEEKLEDLRGRIQALTSRLDEARGTKGEVTKQLRQNELRSSDLIKQLHAIDEKLALGQTRLEGLGRERATHLAALLTHRTALKRHLKASYGISRQNYFKILFNQEDPSELARSLTYYGYFRRARVSSIQALAAETNALADIESEIDFGLIALRQLQGEKLEAKAELDEFGAQREQLLAELGAEIESSAEHLMRLKLNEEKLQKLLSGIQQELADVGAIAVGTEPFSSLRGELPWPARGPMIHRFGTRRQSGSLHWQGVLIGAEQGQAVHAISHGRIAFADWLRGFGLLLIIDHGDGFMSLYGRNQSLFKEVGDWVDAGEQVAIVGVSGVDDESGLYFEIRHNGEPKNPVKWCRGATPMASDALVSG